MAGFVSLNCIDENGKNTFCGILLSVKVNRYVHLRKNSPPCVWDQTDTILYVRLILPFQHALKLKAVYLGECGEMVAPNTCAIKHVIISFSVVGLSCICSLALH